MTGHATKCPRRFLNWDFPGFSSVVRQMPGNLLHSPQRPPNPLSLSWFSLQRLTEETDVIDQGQMTYQAMNPWLRTKPVGSRRSLRHRRLYQADNKQLKSEHINNHLTSHSPWKWNLGTDKENGNRIERHRDRIVLFKPCS